MNNERANITDAELEVLKVLWAHGAPMSDRQIRDALGALTGWKKGTIQTLTRRLVAKGALRKESRDVFYYHPAISQEEYAQDRARELLHQVFDGNARSMFATLLGDDVLSDDDVRALHEFWQERRRAGDE